MAIHAQPQLYQENLGLPLCNNSQGWWRTMETGCEYIEPYLNTEQQKQERPSFFHQQQSHLQHHQQQLQMNQDFAMQNGQSFRVPIPRNNLAYSNDQFSVSYSLNLASQMEFERKQLDHYLKIQDEKLRLFLQEQRRQQLGLLMKKLESKTVTLLRQKEAEIAEAVRKQMELEVFLKKLEMEKQEWQRMTQENEVMVETLSLNLDELREKTGSISNDAVDDAESCCDENMTIDMNEHDIGESTSKRLVDVNDDCSGQLKQNRVTGKMIMPCKGCNFRKSCMLFLPCRHLCSCKTCEAFLGCCPVCRMTKKASVEALL